MIHCPHAPRNNDKNRFLSHETDPEMVAVHIFFELMLTQERFTMVWSSLDLYVCVIVHRAMFVMAAPLSSRASVF